MTKQELQEQLQEEALQVIESEKNFGVSIGTGGGKTILGLKHMAKQYTDTCAFLVVASRKSIFDDWIADAKKCGLEHLLDCITFSTYRSLHNQLYLYDWAYFDECHSVTPKNVPWIESYAYQDGSIFGLTGTYPKNKDSDKYMICNEYMPKIFHYSVDEAIDQGILNDYQIYVHMLPLGTKNNVIKKNKKTSGTWKTSETKDYYGLTKAIELSFGKKKQMMYIYRMKAMQSYPSKIEYLKSISNKIDRKALFFVNSIEQAEEVCNHSYHSKNKESDKNLQLFSDDYIYRLSCIDSISEGKNIKNLQVCIITHAYSKDTKTRQRIGRMFRLSPDKKAYIHILCYYNSIDRKWVEKALSSYDQNKIKYYHPYGKETNTAKR